MSETSTNTDRYYGPRWDEIRKQVIKSDGAQCTICLATEDLVVHHRTPLTAFDSHEEANDRDNLATLCKRCHKRIESLQDRHTRRGLDSFIHELQNDGVDTEPITPEFIEWFCGSTDSP